MYTIYVFAFINNVVDEIQKILNLVYTYHIIANYLIYLHINNIIMEKTDKKIGRPSMNTKSYHVKIEGDLAEILDQQPNKNRYINDSIRQRMEKEKLIKKQKQQ